MTTCKNGKTYRIAIIGVLMYMYGHGQHVQKIGKVWRFRFHHATLC